MELNNERGHYLGVNLRFANVTTPRGVHPEKHHYMLIDTNTGFHTVCHIDGVNIAFIGTVESMSWKGAEFHNRYIIIRKVSL